MKRYRLAAIAAAVVLAIVMLAADRLDSRFRLTGVSDVVRQGDTLYILDNQGDSYQLFAADLKGTVRGRIVLPKLVGDWWNTYGSLSVDRDGQVYLYSYGKTMDLGVSKSTVCVCDFESGTLVPRWELPPVKMIRVQVMDGQVCYLDEEEDGQAGFYLMDQENTVRCLLRPGVEYSQVKGFGWRPEEGILWADWNCSFYRNEKLISDGAGKVRDYVDVCVDENGIVYSDMETGGVMRLGWEQDAPQRLFEIGEVAACHENLEYLDLLPFRYDEDGSWLAGVDVRPEYRSLGLFDASGKQTVQMEYLVKSPSARILWACKAACLCLVLMAVAVAAVKLMLRCTKGIVPILVQLLGILIPVILIASMLLDRQIQGFLERRLMKMNYDLLYVIANQRIDEINPDELLKIDLWNLPRDPVYREIFDRRSYSGLEKTIYPQGGGEGEPVIANTYCWMFLEQGGELKYLDVTDRHYFGARVAYDRVRAESSKMREAMELQHIVKSEYNDFSGTFIVLYVPVITTDGRSVGVMECGLNRRILTYEISRQMDQINKNLEALSALLIGMLILVLGYFLRPLSRVRKAVEDVSGGNLGLVVTVRGHDEVAGIAGAFNHMSRQLKTQMEFTGLCAARYASFVPQKVLEVLEREDITQVELGDQREIPAAVLHVGSGQFQAMAKQMNGEELYGMINRALQEMIPIVSFKEGVVETMAGDKLTAYYPGGSRQALETAISICEKMNFLAGEGIQIPLYRMAVHAGRIKVGIIGQQERMAAATISEVMTLASFLQEAAERYGARILVTETAARQIPDFSKRFHTRMIGYLYVKLGGSLEAVYDVYDGDEADRRDAKEETGELFAQGLGDYLAARYYEARLKFARVLRRNPQDLAARVYVYRCDAFCQSDGKQELEVWLEQY